MELTAQWKHVHSYTCVQINDSGFDNALEKYYGYLPHIHVCFCGCADVKLMSHTFRNGVCTGCGYTKPGATEAKLEVSYWKEGTSNAWMRELDRTVKINNEVSVSAYDEIGNYQFSKWQYSLDNGTTWDELAAETMVGFIIPRSMQVRAIYVNSLTEPKVNLSAREYTVSEQGYLWDSVLFQMEYKLPDGYAYVDAGVKMGDNQGISFYAITSFQVFETK